MRMEYSGWGRWLLVSRRARPMPALCAAAVLALAGGCSGGEPADASSALAKAESFRYDLEIDVKLRGFNGLDHGRTYRAAGAGLPAQRRLELTIWPAVGPYQLIVDGDTTYTRADPSIPPTWVKGIRSGFGDSFDLAATGGGQAASYLDTSMSDPAFYLPSPKSKKYIAGSGDTFSFFCSLQDSVTASCKKLGLDLGSFDADYDSGEVHLKFSLDGDGRPSRIHSEISFSRGPGLGGTVTTTMTLRDYGAKIAIQPPG